MGGLRVILLDTNVVSEPMKPRGDARVLHWLNMQEPATLFLSTTSLSELLLGIEVMPPGRRRDGMADLLRRSLDRFFGSRILPFDESAATVYSQMMARTRSNGYSVSIGDGQIAAVAIAAGFAVATRDMGPFVAAGVKTINPWLS